MTRHSNVAYGEAKLPPGIRSRFVRRVNGLDMHVLEAGSAASVRGAVLLLHGFPELAYSWRKIMPLLADAGYHVIAPDQRGYGRTTGWDADYDGDVASFRMLNLVRDAIGLVFALGYRSVAAVVGHDFGSPVAAWCALLRPDVFHSAVLMSAPFVGSPALPFDFARAATRATDVYAELAALARPRKHYQRYYARRAANDDMLHCPQGVHDFLRAYYHAKSGDYEANRPFPLRAWTAEELAKLPTYYVMDADRTMPETVAPAMPSAAEIAACDWLTEEELSVYSTEFARTGFQGGLNWYRCLDPKYSADLQVFAGRRIEVPTCFIAGARDWGIYQVPGALEKMATVCADFRGVELIEGAGHWVQQERADAVTERILRFLKSV